MDRINSGTAAYDLLYAGKFTPTGPVFDLAQVEENHIRHVLHHTSGNKTEAARLLNIGLTTLYRKIAEYQIS